MCHNIKSTNLVILDRDGVINFDSDDYIKSPDEWLAIPGSIEAIAKLTKANIKIAIATNQSGLARNYFDLHTLHAIHQKMLNLIKQAGGKINYIAFCPHGPDDQCLCRKPKIGLLTEISQKLNIALNTNIYFIGDSYKDIQAALAAKCTPVLVKTGKGEKTLKQYPELSKSIMVCDNLLTAINQIIIENYSVKENLK